MGSTQSTKTNNVAIIGTGYVGLVTGVCLASCGASVTCYDIDAKKIQTLQNGSVPFFEPDIENLLKKCLKAGSIRFTHSGKEAVGNAPFIFICVGTPPKRNGSADLRAYFSVIDVLPKVVKGKGVRSLFPSKRLLTPFPDPIIVVNKSTVPIGTAAEAQRRLQKYFHKGELAVVSNPEFLREGKAVHDFMHPDRIVFGIERLAVAALKKRVTQGLLSLYTPFKAPRVITDWETAELIKYASNAFLATKVSFINEIANVCDAVGADVSFVAQGMGYDKRIGPQFLKAGVGYGGSCFPKDVHALHYFALSKEYHFKLLKAVIEVNAQQRENGLKHILTHLPRPFSRACVGVLGLTFKPDTDDTRESASIFIIQKLMMRGVHIRAYDQKGSDNAQKELAASPCITLCKNPYEAAAGADVLFLATEWKEFLSLDWKRISVAMRGKTIIDGRNALPKEDLKRLGFTYVGFGRR